MRTCYSLAVLMAVLCVAPVVRAEDVMPPRPAPPPIIPAVGSGNLEAVRALLRRQPELANYAETSLDDKGGAGFSVLHWAANRGYADVAELLLAHKADPNVKDFLGNTPLHLAARRGDTVTARHLLRYGADADARGEAGSTPLHFAAGKVSAELMRALLDRGARVDAADKAGLRPLHHALWSDYRKARDPARQRAAVDLLLARGAFADPLAEAALGRARAVRLFLAVDPSRLHHSDSRGRTLLHWAAMAGQREVVTLLLDNGVDPNAADDFGDTPLHVAIRCGQPAVVATLALRADPNRYDGYGLTALAVARADGEWLSLATILACRPDARMEGRRTYGDISQTPCD
jgi:ankyrin repeat protein